MSHLSLSLPISEKIDEIKNSLNNSNRLILQASPGAGKTTAVPLALFNEAWLEGKKILMLEPRRLAAKSAALRMSELLGTPLGKEVGYHIRSDRCFDANTKIIVVTEGILTRYLQFDPALELYGLVIFDEYHERHLQSDLSLAFALQTQELLRNDLRILVMSATLDIPGLQQLLDFPPLITSEGRIFPVSVVFRNPKNPPLEPRELISEITRTILEAHRNEKGDILVFLPGEREIRQLQGKLNESPETAHTGIFPLYANLNKDEQERAILPSSKRKIVLSTNIAETSLTIEGIRIVVDSGLERVSKFDPSSGMERLVTQKISRASAEQRTGRAGRLGEGKCYRLWSEFEHQNMAAHRDAQILVCDLSPLRLELAQWGSSVEELRWLDPPPAASLLNAENLLRSIRALNDHSITPHGSRLIQSAIHPRLGHMIEMCRAVKLQYEALIVAVLLSEPDILSRDEHYSDLGERFWLLQKALKSKHPSRPFSKSVQTCTELSSRLDIVMSEHPDPSLGLILSFAYPDRIARSKGEGKYLSASGKEFYLPQDDPMARYEWLVIAQSDGHSTRSKIHLCSSISFHELMIHHETLFRKGIFTEWNPESERVESRAQVWFGSILLEAVPVESPDSNLVRAQLLEGIAEKGIASLQWDEKTKALQRRLIAFRYHFGVEGSLDYTDDDLVQRFEEWLLPYLHSFSSLEECRKLDWHSIFLGTLSWEEQQLLEQSFPQYLKAPTGTLIAIDYSDLHAPMIRIRIQEMFGLQKHPTIIDGKMPLIIHLLSPAGRPIQVTRDLPGFWSGSYNDVKKELKGRYPKHYWPDDPLAAQATKKTKKHMSSV